MKMEKEKEGEEGGRGVGLVDRDTRANLRLKEDRNVGGKQSK